LIRSLTVNSCLLGCLITVLPLPITGPVLWYVPTGRQNVVTIVAEIVDHAVGVDTHRDTHSAAVICAKTTAVVAEITVGTGIEGCERLWEWANTNAGPGLIWAIEGCGSYGVGLTRLVEDRAGWVHEVERPNRAKRQTPGKDDQIDAIRAGREVLGQTLDRVAAPRHGQDRDSLAVLLMARTGSVEASKAALNQLHAAIVVAPVPLRARFDGLTTPAKVKAAAKLRPGGYINTHERAWAQAVTSLAKRIRCNQHEADQLENRMKAIIETWRPDLLEVNGVGPIVAATVLCAWSHPGRCRNEAAFASLAGTAPIPASTGQRPTMRLNPGGDRKLNAAIHTIVTSRLRWHAETIAYRDRRRAEGKTDRAIKRTLKRYVTRQLHKQLSKTP